MELYIGGYAQGKLRYVFQLYPKDSFRIIDGAKEEIPEEKLNQRVVLNHFHLWVKRQMEKGLKPQHPLEEFLKNHEDCIIICDEIGNGIVPLSQTDRDYRDQVGKLQAMLALKADKVERIICGIGQRLK